MNPMLSISDLIVKANAGTAFLPGKQYSSGAPTVRISRTFVLLAGQTGSTTAIRRFRELI